MRMFELLETGPATTTLGRDIAMSGHASIAGRYTANDDKIGQKHFGDTRKPKITLKMLNKLKMIRAAKKLEMLQKQKVLGIMYGAAPDDDASPI